MGAGRRFCRRGWDIITGPDPTDRFAAYSFGLAAASAFVLVLKLGGAVVAVAAIQPWHAYERVVATALWGGFGLLTLYSAGNVVIWVATVTGLMEPSAAWQAAGGVSVGAVLYVGFFPVGAALFGVLAVSYHRRHRTRWISAVIGIVGAPVVLALLLVVVPGILGRLDLLPTWMRVVTERSVCRPAQPGRCHERLDQEVTRRPPRRSNRPPHHEIARCRVGQRRAAVRSRVTVCCGGFVGRCGWVSGLLGFGSEGGRCGR